jgi:hypothetical protein
MTYTVKLDATRHAQYDSSKLLEEVRMGDAQLNAWVPKDLKARLKAVLAFEERSFSQWLRDQARHYVDEHGNAPAGQSRGVNSVGVASADGEVQLPVKEAATCELTT